MENANRQSYSINLKDGLRILLRTSGYIRYFKVRLAAKLGLITFEHLFRLLLLPWPVKIIIDHVILGAPISGQATGFPNYIAPFLLLLQDLTETEIMAWMFFLGVTTVMLLGVTLNRTATNGAAFGKSAPGASGPAFAYLTDGHDSATKTENQANFSISAMGGLLGLLDFKIQLRLSQAMCHLLRTELADRIINLPLSTIEEQRIGDSAYRVLFDSASANIIIQELIMGLFGSLLMLVVTISIMLSTYGEAPEVILVGLLVGPITFLLSTPFAKLLRQRSEASRAAGSETTTNIEEGMSNILLIQSLGGNTQESNRFADASNNSFIQYRKMIVAQLLLGVSGTFAFVLGQVFFFLLMAGHVIDGTYSAGDYFVVLYYFFVLSAVSFSFGFIFSELQESAAGMARVFNLLDTPREESEGKAELQKIRHSLSFEGVGLTYPDGRVALHQVSINAQIGEIVALVGPTGAGKTTLAHLVPSLLKPTEGKITIDGTNISDISLSNLRQQISYIFQETQLFPDSVLENIRYGNKTASTDDVQRVARIAGAHNFICSLPEGYNTNLGTVFAKLSVGQKQRISIARGLLKQSQILILDEPTSALDPETESYLIDALNAAVKEKIVIIIAHRLSTISQANMIYFMEAGEVKESGTHDELISIQDSRYREFIILQSGSI